MPKGAASRAAPVVLRGLLPVLLALGPTAVAAASSVLSAELSAVGGYSDGDGWTLDGAGSQTNSVGFEYLGRFSGDRGDYLTLDLQARVSYDPMRPDDDGPWAVEVHNAWIEHRLGLGSNVRAGHFEPAFGLERTLDTHGTLLQTLIGDDVGFKHDWGAAYRGILGPFDIEAAAQLGSGMGVERKDGSFLASSRISSPPGGTVSYGVSLLYGRVLESMGMRTIPRPVFAPEAVTKARAGLDAQWDAGVLALAGEMTAGTDDGEGAFGALVQAGWRVPGLETLTLEAQGRYRSGGDGDDDASLAVCASLQVSQGWTLRAALLPGPGGAADDAPARAVLHAYYYGGLP